jgi:hypothetical protein
MSSKTITIDSQSLKIGGRKKTGASSSKKVPAQLNINSSNIRQLLIDKLRKSRKTQKNPPKVNTNTFDNHSTPSYLEPKLSMPSVEPMQSVQSVPQVPQVQPVQSISVIETVEETPSSVQINTNDFPESTTVVSVISPDKPYGVLKNGTKPTFKTWNQAQKSEDTVKVENVISTPMIQESEIKKTYSIGKNKKSNSIGVLIKNIHTRRKIEEDIVKHKKTNLTTVKNYLKTHNMIKHGTTAPTNLLRTIFENMKLCGDVSNDNMNNLLHNFEKD